METEKETILIVDDQPYNLKLISTYLSKKYKVAIANNGENALEVLKNITPDLILLDVLMPGMNGLEVCKKIKDNTKTKDVPIIFLTAQNDPEFVVNGFTNGAVDYITKPFNPSEVFVRISSQLELKRAKAELQEANSKFDALNKQKDKLFSIISHDLKGPFAGIIGLCRSLIRDIESGEASIDKNTVLPPLSLMLQSGESAYKLLENLLTWSKTLSDRYELSLTNVPIKNLTLQSIELHRSYATKKDITIKNDVNKEIVVLADLYMINTVIRNLIANAIKFTYPNGIITIQANVQEEFVAISVKDTGVGIDQEKIGKLFNIGGIVATKGTDEEKGTGLGLFICKEFVEKNGGKIEVESELGKGSTFTVVLPKA